MLVREKTNKHTNKRYVVVKVVVCYNYYRQNDDATFVHP